jgi:hypothetical protein
VHVRPSRCFGNAEDLADLGERQPFLVAERQRGTLLRPDSGHRSIQGVPQRFLFERIGIGRRRGVEIAAGGRIERDGRNPRSSERVERRVVRDAEQPGGQPPLRVERGKTAERLDEGVLREILGQRGIAGDAEDEPDDRPLIPADDLLDGSLRTGQRLGNQPGLGDSLEINRYGSSPLRALRRECVRRCSAATRPDGSGLRPDTTTAERSGSVSASFCTTIEHGGSP